MKKTHAFFSFIAALFLPLAALADLPDHGIAKPWQLGFQQAASPVMEELVWLHDHFLMYIITGISIFVLVVMIVIAVKYNRKANPVASKNSHNTKLEIVWTVIPVLILVIIAIPSLRTHYIMEDESNAEMTLKVLGYQWYWHYEYPDHGGINFDSYMKKDNELGEGDHRLLSVDNNVVVPVDTKIRVLLTGADVIHAWAVPAFGVKRDAVPGRLNETWFTATKIGRYYGQCSELCGVGHGFMPIVVDVVSKEDFAAWVSAQQKKAGIAPKDAAPANDTKKEEKL
jgi:cytochrome c oxidase subunit 2